MRRPPLTGASRAHQTGSPWPRWHGSCLACAAHSPRWHGPCLAAVARSLLLASSVPVWVGTLLASLQCSCQDRRALLTDRSVSRLARFLLAEKVARFLLCCFCATRPPSPQFGSHPARRGGGPHRQQVHINPPVLYIFCISQQKSNTFTLRIGRRARRDVLSC
jgi:hypothetical protein